MVPPCLLTWDTLAPYLERRVAAARQNAEKLRNVVSDDHPGLGEQAEADWQRRIVIPLEGLVSLVEEMRRRPSVQRLIPILSMETLRLFRPRGASDEPGLGDEIAHIHALGEGLYRITPRRTTSEGYETLAAIEGRLAEIAELVQDAARNRLRVPPDRPAAE